MINEQTNIGIGRISYINVAPVYYGLDRGLKPEWFELVTAPPAELNKRLESGEIQISPVSSAAYAKNHRDWLLLSDLSISSNGKVMSVILASHIPIENLEGKRILLSEESASAAALVRILLAEKGEEPNFVRKNVSSPLIAENDCDAALVIGDAALTEDWQGSFRYIYDLGELWKESTGLPFVFAVWAVRKKFARKYPEKLAEISNIFIRSKESARANYPEIINLSSKSTGLSIETCEAYFNYLDCDLNQLHIKGLEAFFEGMYRCGIISERVAPEII